MNIAQLLCDPNFCEPFELLHSVETLVKGRAIISTQVEPASGVVQPAQAKDLERLPEGDRDRETIAVYTQSPLRVGEGEGPTKADAIRFSEALYTITSVEAWPKYGYYKALCQRTV